MASLLMVNRAPVFTPAYLLFGLHHKAQVLHSGITADGHNAGDNLIGGLLVGAQLYDGVWFQTNCITSALR